MALRRLFDRFRRPPIRDMFARDLMQGLGAAGDNAGLRYDAETGRIERLIDGKTEATINLGNQFPTYLTKEPGERTEYLHTCIRSALTHLRKLPEDFEASRPDLRPRVWTRPAIERSRLCTLISGEGLDVSRLPSIPVGDHLIVSLAYDWPESVQFINQDNLETWGVSFYEAFEAAWENLRETTVGHAAIGEVDPKV